MRVVLSLSLVNLTSSESAKLVYSLTFNNQVPRFQQVGRGRVTGKEGSCYTAHLRKVPGTPSCLHHHQSAQHHASLTSVAVLVVSVPLKHSHIFLLFFLSLPKPGDWGDRIYSTDNILQSVHLFLSLCPATELHQHEPVWKFHFRPSSILLLSWLHSASTQAKFHFCPG